MNVARRIPTRFFSKASRVLLATQTADRPPTLVLRLQDEPPSLLVGELKFRHGGGFGCLFETRQLRSLAAVGFSRFSARSLYDDCRAAHLRETDCVAENVAANYPFERSHRFAGIEPILALETIRVWLGIRSRRRGATCAMPHCRFSEPSNVSDLKL
jgi:hypothetical protein